MIFTKKLINATASLVLTLGMVMSVPAFSEEKGGGDLEKNISTERIVYGSPVSPFVFKVLVTMAEKGLDFKMIETLPVRTLKAMGKKANPAFVKASPLGKIPAYQEGNWTIADSSVIMGYLDRQNPKVPLYPAEPKKFAETLWFEKYGDEIVAGVVHHKILFEKIVKPKLFNKPTDEVILQEAITKELPEILAYLEKELKGKKWIVGDRFTAADIAIGAHLVSLKQCGVNINAEQWPNLSAYTQRLFDRPSFKKNMR
jgi:glutathione S-transferase